METAGARSRVPVDRLEWRIIAAMVAVEALLVALNGLNTISWHSNFFIIENEANLPTWFSSTQLAFAAGACGLAGLPRASGSSGPRSRPCSRSSRSMK